MPPPGEYVSLALLLTFDFLATEVYDERPFGWHHAGGRASFLRLVRLCLLLVVVTMRSAADVLMLTTPCGSQLESSYLYAYPFGKDVLCMFTAQCGREAPCESRSMDEMEIKKDEFG